MRKSFQLFLVLVFRPQFSIAHQQKIIKNLNLSVPEGSVFGFIGQNGAGKTTTMKMVLGLLQPDEGEIRVCNEPVRFGQTKTNQYIGYLPDVPEFYNYMTAIQYLTLCGEIVGLSKKSFLKKDKGYFPLSVWMALRNGSAAIPAA